ncbi:MULTISPECIES: hypothetical protein [Burkholderia]|uniref:hypothetical protein n=1 Tax=Burkholderia TaxID=32008 RepID=UPI0012E3DF19|nr:MULTISPECIES: hypothetical protein [Burkholderia]
MSTNDGNHGRSPAIGNVAGASPPDAAAADAGHAHRSVADRTDRTDLTDRPPAPSNAHHAKSRARSGRRSLAMPESEAGLTQRHPCRRRAAVETRNRRAEKQSKRSGRASRFDAAAARFPSVST